VTEEWNSIAAIDDINESEPLAAQFKGAPVCLYRIGEEIFATEGKCTHGHANLADGMIVDDYLIECPLHGGTFDVRTGAAVGAPCTLPVRCFDVQVKNGIIYLRQEQTISTGKE